ncbi:hypothetical protein B0T25DRAFT_301790 [Lasiosphaeria hispida]|uniref:Apple domain-containing protein n=1 Tax=Lasiosphaeria hispida TaxID=260671 RepID=A0AAJ0H8Q7_9PEZI|nr:hypothetical protein B0T25DRAFT_301790 [Lasiosphaeria hispida]
MGGTTTEKTTATVLTTLVSLLTQTTTVIVATIQNQQRALASSQCTIGLTTKTLTKHPASSLSSVCSCLGIEAEVMTVTIESTAVASTATATETSTTTEIVSETSTLTEVSVTSETETATVVSTAVATQTVAVCDIAYDNLSQSTSLAGTDVVSVTASGARDCCEQCQRTPNCFTSGWFGTFCQHRVRSAALAGAVTNDQCPLGLQDYNYGAPSPSGVVYQGPCGVPT